MLYITFNGIFLLSIIAALSGCVNVPDLGPQAQLRTQLQVRSTQTLASLSQDWPEEQWWTTYGDTQLNTLIEEALANAPDLAIAKARILNAEGVAQQAAASRLPSLDLNTSVTRLKQSYNNGVPAAFVPQGFNDSTRVSLDFSYEIDFWGKNRASLAAASSELEAAKGDAAQSRLILTSSVASSYADLARLFADHDTAIQAVEVRRRSAIMLQDRQRNGLETQGSVSQADSRLAAAQADLIANEEEIALQRNSLVALLGAGPDRGEAIVRPTIKLSHAQLLPDVQADLLGRRPDLAAARFRAEAAAKRIDVARSGFYPNVNLSAYVGVQSLGLDLLTKAGSGIAGIGPALALPIFHGSQLQGNYRTAHADYESAVASYNLTLSQALREVADAVTQQRILLPQLQKRQAALKAAEQAYSVANDRYKVGLANYLDVLNTEDNVIDARRTLTDLQSRHFNRDIALIKALGGGYKNNLSD